MGKYVVSFESSEVWSCEFIENAGEINDLVTNTGAAMDSLGALEDTKWNVFKREVILLGVLDE